MGDLLGCIDASEPSGATVARVREGVVMLAVVSSLAMSTFIAAAALAGPISRSSALAVMRLRSANSADETNAKSIRPAWRPIGKML